MNTKTELTAPWTCLCSSCCTAGTHGALHAIRELDDRVQELRAMLKHCIDTGADAFRHCEALATALECACRDIDEEHEQGAFEYRGALVRYRDSDVGAP